MATKQCVIFLFFFLLPHSPLHPQVYLACLSWRVFCVIIPFPSVSGLNRHHPLCVCVCVFTCACTLCVRVCVGVGVCVRASVRVLLFVLSVYLAWIQKLTLAPAVTFATTTPNQSVFVPVLRSPLSLSLSLSPDDPDQQDADRVRRRGPRQAHPGTARR